MPPETVNIILGYVLAVVYVLFAIGLALVFYKFGLPKKFTRKIVHILVGFEWFILSHFMGASYHFLIVCVVFTLGLALSYFKKLLPAMSSDGENDPGTVYYGISMTVMTLVSMFVPEMLVPFGVGVFCTSFGDGLAGVVGQLIKKHNPKIFRNKSLFGTLTNLFVSFATVLIFRFAYGMNITVWHCLFIAILSAGLELIGAFGLDNLFITLGVAFFTYSLMTWDNTMLYVVPIITAPILVAAIVEKRALTPAGLILAMLMDLTVSAVFGNMGFLVLITFFVGSLVTDKIKKLKKREDGITKKDGTRDIIQVIANGIVPTFMAGMYGFTGEVAFLIAYVASFAEAFADTVASGFGVYSKGTFDLFKMRKCECGISGGMSFIGTFSALVAAAVVSLYLGTLNWWYVLVSAVAAFLGVIFDSFLGSLFQIKFKCTKCGKITERYTHCDAPTKQIAGFAFFDNDVVNLLSGVFAAALAITAGYIFF